MKRLICILLAVCISLVFCSCSKGETSSEPEKIDVEYYAKLGKIPECKYPLGTDADSLLNDLSSTVSEGDETAYNVTEGERSVLIESGQFAYYYVKENKSAGISYIVSYGDSYGFRQGSVIIEIEDAMKKAEAEELTLSADNAFFMPTSDNLSVLCYKFGKNTVMFVFEDNSLSATAVYSNDNWTI